MLVAFFLLIWDGLVANTNDMAFAKILRNTNLANLIVWSYWWPLIVVSAVFLGRVWCMVCPVELVTSLSARIGLKRKTPQWFQSGWVITIFYIIIVFIGIHTFSIHRVPFRMAIYLMTLFVLATITGLIFQKNAFCAYVCPVGHLLGLYARIAPFGWGVKDKDVCKNCKDKSCIANKNIYKFQAKSCGVNLVPQNLDDNTNCLLGGQCLKACDKYKSDQSGRPNPGWFRRPFAKDLFSLKSLNLAQTFFLLVVSGFVIYEIVSEWSVTKGIILYAPNLIRSQLSLKGIWAEGFTNSFTLFLLIPILIWMIPFCLYSIADRELSLSSYLKTFGIAFIPIMASAHLIKAILKTTSRIPYWGISLNDPIGIQTAREITDKTLILYSNPAWLQVVISISVFLLILAGIVLSVIIIKKLVREKLTNQKVGFIFYLIPVIYGGIFVVMIITWRFSLFTH